MPVWPVDGDGLVAAEAVAVADVAVADAEFVNQLRNFDIEAAVLRDLHDFAFAPPADGVEAVGGFSGAEGGGGDVVEFDAVAEFFFDIEEEVETGHHAADVPHAVALKDAVIEFHMIESDDEVGPGHGGDELVDLFFSVDGVGGGGGAVEDADGHAHFVLVFPAAHIAGGALGFEIEVDEVPWHG